MWNRNQSKANGKPHKEDSQQNATNFPISAMAASWAAPDNRHNSPCFRFTLHFYLPSQPALGSDQKMDTILHLRVQFRGHFETHNPQQNAGDMSSDGEHATRARSALHKICLHLRNHLGRQAQNGKSRCGRADQPLRSPHSAYERPGDFGNATDGPFPANPTVGTMPLVTGVSSPVHRVFRRPLSGATKAGPTPKVFSRFPR